MKTIILRGPAQRDYLSRLLAALNPAETWEVVIRKHDPKRSLDQNARLWELFARIGKSTGYTKDDVHALMCQKFLGKKLVMGEEVQITTRNLGKKAMADFQTQVEAFCAQMGFDVWGDE